MNPWAKDECQAYVDAVELEEDEWFTRYSLVGGNPRLLFSSKQTVDELINEVSIVIPTEFTKLEYVMRGVERGKFGDRMRNALFEMYRDVEKTGQYFLQFASDIIYTMVSSNYDGERNDRIRDLLQTSDPNLQAWRGRVCERCRRQRNSCETSPSS
ncbi:hypothetical protein V7S43_018244 [Phytophthora oleae]|uniref:Helitron helicase-like domain-containing protein n=1 Tax=Phytophthora oleae TaxID=2107226 RepID=A0ABD3ER53_9STRA